MDLPCDLPQLPVEGSVLDVDPVQQRPGKPAAVLEHLDGVAPAFAPGIAVMVAGAWVHGRHQHELRRERHGAGCARDGDPAILERLAQHLEGRTACEAFKQVGRSNGALTSLTPRPFEPVLI